MGKIYEPSKDWDKIEKKLDNMAQGIDSYLENLKDLFKTASEARNETDFKYAMDRARSLTKTSEPLIENQQKYTGENQETSILDFLYSLFDGLKAMSRGDIKTAKIQAEFMSVEIENRLKEKNV